jgi:hypothetical protein
MLSKTKVLSAMVGLAMLALPTAAFAGHHDGGFHGHGWHHGWNHGRRGGWRGRGWNNGWYGHGEGDDGDDDGGGYRWGRPGWRGGDDGGWRQYGYGCDDDCGGGRWGGYNGAYNNGYFPGGAYGPNQLNSLIAQRQRTTIELERMRARGDSRGAARMASILQGINGRIARSRGGYGYGAPVTPLTTYPGAYNSYGYGNYPYNGNTANAIGSLMGPLLGIR